MEDKTPFKIFLVDDEPYCLQLYAQYLNNLGYTNLRYFSKSAQCLDQLSLQPDLIFLDYNMDSLNGIDLLKKIKRFDPNIMVIFISGQDEIAVAVNALKYGAFDYITKVQITEEKIAICLDKVHQIREILAMKSQKGVIKKLLTGAGIISAVFFLQKFLSRF